MSTLNERPLAERLAKWQRTWKRIAERVFDEDDDSRVQTAQDEIRTEINNSESKSKTSARRR